MIAFPVLFLTDLIKRSNLHSEHGAADGTDGDIAVEDGKYVAVFRGAGSVDGGAGV